MISSFALKRYWILASLLAMVAGCSSDQRASDAASENHGKDASGAQAAEDDTDASADKPFVLGDLIKPFDPPPLEELDKTADWQDRPVLDGLDVLRSQQDSLQPPPIPVKEALALRNTSDEKNDEILNSLGRLPPPDGKDIDYDATWVRHVAGDLKSTNPILRSSVTEFEFVGMTSFNGGAMIGNDRELNYFASADIYKSWQTSKDHTMDKFVLRDDLTWSDGKPITAHDIEFSFKVTMTSTVPALAVRSSVERFSWVQAYDDHTVVIFHKEPFATNDSDLENFSIIPQHMYEHSIADDPTFARSEYHTRLEDHPVVGGPYELTKRVRNQEFVLRRRESYYMHDGKQVRPKPFFQEIRTKVMEDLNTALLALKTGQIESMILRPEHWFTQADDADFYRLNTKVHAVEWTEFHFVWNENTPYFSDRRVRQAMSWAYDYKELLGTICQRTLSTVPRSVSSRKSGHFPRTRPSRITRIWTRRKICSTRQVGRTATAMASAIR